MMKFPQLALRENATPGQHVFFATLKISEEVANGSISAEQANKRDDEVD
jgi:hypothetical protein